MKIEDRDPGEETSDHDLEQSETNMRFDKKSIRAAATERRKKTGNSIARQPSPVPLPVLRRRAVKLWGIKVREETPSPSSESESPRPGAANPNVS